MSNETITPERIALPKQVVEALAEAWRNDDVCGDGERKILELGARIALAALANEPCVDEKVLQAARRHWDAGGNSKGEQYDVFMCREYQQQCFLAPQPKLPENVQSIVDDYRKATALTVAEWRNLMQEMAEKIMAVTAVKS